MQACCVSGAMLCLDIQTSARLPSEGQHCQWRTQEFFRDGGGGGVKQITFRAEDRENGGLGAVGP
jgi:hypothetical protein